MVTQTELLESPEITPFHFCLWGSMKSEMYKRKVDTPDEPLARILDVEACIKKRENQLRRTTLDLRTRVGECSEVDGGILESLL
jgi:hypothetical protein